MEIIVRSWPQAIALVDCDNFYVSCEIILNPRLRGKSICVLSNNDGCVISRSKEAKALGIKMGEVAYIAKKKFPETIYLSSNFHFYGQISEKVMVVLKEFTPEIEIYSIDEAFLNLTGTRQIFKKTYIEIAKDIREEVLKRTGIPVSIGISLSKVLAKIAAKIAKDDKSSVFAISGKQLREILPKIPIESIWQIGINTASLLKKFEINSAYDFACQDEKWVEKVLTKKGLELLQEICGCYVWKVVPASIQPKGVQRTKSFSKSTQDKEIVKGSLHYHLHRALTELRVKNLKAGSLTIMLRKKDFQTVSLNCVIYPPSNFEFDLTGKINTLFEKLYEPNTAYRSSGVYLTNLILNCEEQLNLFTKTQDTIKKEKLGKTWDLIEEQFGRQTIRTASMPTLNYLDKRSIRGYQKYSSFDNLPEVH